ncbi:ras guanine nucleotide exchange factor P-like isoform X2 [Aphidius gifuensis]|uniref:ras guanine nucleotide exchange factor P-like isoform X2 n=1 Tax=Aphidius gifuensis TaxID=684658 RepID=UPI001CDB78FA|nr:ras guanine nucleotide exchange factor P-like isoform X2 [Aphidius gifuensis]
MDNYYLNSSSGSARTKSAKWVCPNDRQLALRAKLKTGWSVKSASLDSRSFDYSRYSTASCPGNLSSTKNNQPLTEEERERIIEVIKKADALDLSEQERVGKLVDRLENMKKNVTVVTSTRASGRNCASRCIRGNKCVCCCALCGEKFSVLGAGPGLCRDCRNYVCQKCGIETTTSTSSTNINTNTLSTSPSAATNTGQQQPQQQQQTTTITIGSTTNLTDNVKQQQQQPTTPPAKIFLCRICTETREMWKKSGAWFFKSLPKYVLPEKKPRGGSRGSHWTLAGGSRSLEPSELDSSSDEDLSRRPTRTRSFLFYSKSLDPSSSSLDQNKQNNNDSDVDTDKSSRKGSFLNLNVPDNNQQQQNILLSPQNQLMVPNTSSAFSTSPTSPSPSSSLSPVPRSRSSSRLRDQKESQSSSSSSSPPPPPPPSTSTSQSSIFYIPFPSIIGGSCESINNNNNNNNNNDNNNNNNNGKIILMTSNNNSNNSYNNNNNKIISGERKSSIQEKKEEINNMIDNNNGTRKSRRQSDSTLQYQQQQQHQHQQHQQQQRDGKHVLSTRPRSKSTTSLSTTNGKSIRNGEERTKELRKSRDNTTIRTTVSLSSVQSGTCKGSTCNGHTGTHGFILQTECVTNRRGGQENNTKMSENKDSIQDTRSRIQRAAQLLRNHRERLEDKQSIARINSIGRCGRPGLSRRSQISLARTTALSNEILQRYTGGTSGFEQSGQANMGRGHEQRSRKNSIESDIQHTSTCTISKHTTCK